jgi:hypothetical protein
MKAWLKTALVGCGGGASSALMAALLDPGFNVKYRLGEGKLLLMVLQGAAVGVVALWMRSPSSTACDDRPKPPEEFT